MKKVFSGVTLLALVFAFSANVASAAKPSTSWQDWYGFSNRLVVYINDSKSAICFDGKREDYDGSCTSPASYIGYHSAKLSAIAEGKEYIDTDWECDYR